MTYEDIISIVKKEFENFDLHDKVDFSGGKFQTTIPNVFAHIKHDGTLGKIEIKKEGGTKFYINI